MGKTKKQKLQSCMQNAMNIGAEHFYVFVKHEDYEGLEIIINPKENFADKLKYYMEAYDDDLVLKNCNKIKIVSFMHR
ncbi:MAG: hypothetical protein RR420_01120 [Anaerovoracaceae bacterium]